MLVRVVLVVVCLLAACNNSLVVSGLELLAGLRDDAFDLSSWVTFCSGGSSTSLGCTSCSVLFLVCYPCMG